MRTKLLKECVEETTLFSMLTAGKRPTAATKSSADTRKIDEEFWELRHGYEARHGVNDPSRSPPMLHPLRPKSRSHGGLQVLKVAPF